VLVKAAANTPAVIFGKGATSCPFGKLQRAWICEQSSQAAKFAAAGSDWPFSMVFSFFSRNHGKPQFR
jgi:hypothetical protein